MEGLPVELLECIFVKIRFNDLLNSRLVCKRLDQEVLRLIQIGKCRRRGLVDWNRRGRFWVGEFKAILGHTNNHFLFNSCFIGSDRRFEMIYKYFFPRYGALLETMHLDLVQYTPWIPGGIEPWPSPTKKGSSICELIQNMFMIDGFCPNIRNLRIGAGEIACLSNYELCDYKICSELKCKSIENLVLTDSFFIFFRDISAWLMRSTRLTEASLLTYRHCGYSCDTERMEKETRLLVERFKSFANKCKERTCVQCHPVHTIIKIKYRVYYLHVSQESNETDVIESHVDSFCRHEMLSWKTN